MTDKELEQLLRKKVLDERTDAPQRKNVALVLSPHIVRTAAHLKKRRQDRIQTMLCTLAAVVFMLVCVLVFFLTKDAENPLEILKYAGITALGGGVLFLICAPALIWHEENS